MFFDVFLNKQLFGVLPLGRLFLWLALVPYMLHDLCAPVSWEPLIPLSLERGNMVRIEIHEAEGLDKAIKRYV